MNKQNGNGNGKRDELSVTYKANGLDVRLTPTIVQNYLVSSDAQITMPEFKFFTELCRARGLNPFLKEAYLIKYGKEPAQIVVGKDAVFKRGTKHPAFDGMESGIIVVNSNHEVIDRPGTFYMGGETVVGGWARVFRTDWKYPYYVSVPINEVAQRKKDGNFNNMWRNKPGLMIEKVAKVRALREAFSEELAGMYEAEEMSAEIPADNIIITAPPTSNPVTEIVDRAAGAEPPPPESAEEPPIPDFDEL